MSYRFSCKLLLVAASCPLCPLSRKAVMLAGQVADLPEVRRRAAPRPARPRHRRERTASVRRERARRSAQLDRPMSEASSTPAAIRAE